VTIRPDTEGPAEPGVVLQRTSGAIPEETSGALTLRYSPLSIGFRQLWLAGCAAFALQAAMLVAWSRHLWIRFDLTQDFATFSQAWNQIGTGHLNPYESTFAYYYPHYGYAFWQSHLELIMWPLALLRALGANSFSLLVVQDLALAGFGLVAFRLGLELLQRHWGPGVAGGSIVAIGLLVALLVTPWTYWAASFDFHFQPIAAFFLVLCARDVWNGRRRSWWWVVAVLLCGDVAASYLIGLGMAAVLSGKSTRRMGWKLIASGFVWILFVVAIGSGKGSSLAGNYGYLAHAGNSSGLGATAAVVFGILRHPFGVISVLHSRWSQLYKFIASSGTIGAVSALGFGLGLVILVPDALNQSGVFIGATAGFQNLVAVIFMTVGVVSVLTWVLPRRHGLAIAVLLGSASLIQVIAMSIQWIPQIPSNFSVVNASTAGQLAQIQGHIPTNAEVVVSQGVIGRFGSHLFVYPFLDAFADGQIVPVNAGTVAFVFVAKGGLELATPAQTQAAITMVQSRLHAQKIPGGPDVTAFLWHPPPGTRALRFAP
jgi:hypothetical protein